MSGEKKLILCPWDDGFWEIYHSKPPLDWQQKIASQGTIYLAPDLVSGGLNYVSCPEEYYERETETQEWITTSMIDPAVNPYSDWYPFQEFDIVPEEEDLFV